MSVNLQEYGASRIAVMTAWNPSREYHERVVETFKSLAREKGFSSEMVNDFLIKTGLGVAS
jgi:hypothetical protein